MHVLETQILPCFSLEEERIGQDRVLRREPVCSSADLGGDGRRGSMDLKALLDAGTQPSSVQLSHSV